MRKTLSILLAVGALGSAAHAQDQHDVVAPPAGFERALDAWRLDHGSSWRAIPDRRTGHLELLHGGGAQPVFAPSTSREADWFALARHWVTETEALHGIAEYELRDEKFVYLPLGLGNGTDKVTVRLTQVVQGLPVEGAKVNALFDTAGRLLSLHSTAAALTDHLQIVPTVDGKHAQRRAIAAFEVDAGVPALDVGPPLMLFAQVDDGMRRQAVLAYQVRVMNAAEPAGYVYTVDAGTGAVLRRDDEVHSLDVTGTVTSMATPGVESPHPGNPPTEQAMPYINVTSSAGTVQTDRDGNFVFPGVNTPLDITVEYVGTFNDVQNQAGPDYSITFPNVQPNQANTLLMNPSPTEFNTAQANAYLHVPVMRDWIRDTNPADSTADFQAVSQVNLSSSCNAFFVGNATQYLRANSSCYNSAYSSVVAHEMGHWLNVLYGTTNDPGGMGEGNADVFSNYLYDHPIIAPVFYTNGGFIRTAENTRQFCGDCCDGCYGGYHTDGEVWMGAAWKVRRNLKTSLGDALGRATADQIFVNWMSAYNQTKIRSIIEIQWLTLDDDDADIDNGTPNYPAINDGFLEQGFPGFDIDLDIGTKYCGPAESNSTGFPAEISASGSVDVAANFVDVTASGMPSNKSVYFIVSQVQGFVQNPGGSDGNLCLGGAIGRHNDMVGTTGLGGTYTRSIDLTLVPTPNGKVAVQPGETWYWQAWYRDNNPFSTSNFTDGICITFQ